MEDETEHESTSENSTEDSDVASPRQRSLRKDRDSSSLAPQPITARQRTPLIKLITKMQNSKRGSYFKHPVDPTRLNIPDYHRKIKSPMDFEKMREKLEEDQYPSISSCMADFDQIVHNTVVYNGEDHYVTRCARTLKRRFDTRLKDLLLKFC